MNKLLCMSPEKLNQYLENTERELLKKSSPLAKKGYKVWLEGTKTVNSSFSPFWLTYGSFKEFQKLVKLHEKSINLKEKLRIYLDQIGLTCPICWDKPLDHIQLDKHRFCTFEHKDMFIANCKELGVK